MSGHSKWASIKHKKGAVDAKRGKLFTHIIKELTVAARAAGGDPDSNPRLRTVIADAKAANMPAENIKRAIRRGTGEEPGVSYEEVTYEAYGPGGAALIIEVMTDNTNRAVHRAICQTNNKQKVCRISHFLVHSTTIQPSILSCNMARRNLRTVL